jgi:hypothetical protein
VVVYGTRSDEIIASNPDEAVFPTKTPCCFLIKPEICIFWKSAAVLYCVARLQVALVSSSPHMFTRPPCWCYLLYKIKKFAFRVVPSGIKSIPNFIQIRAEVLEFNHVDRHTDSDTTNSMCVHFMGIARRTHINHYKKRKVALKLLTRAIYWLMIWGGSGETGCRLWFGQPGQGNRVQTGFGIISHCFILQLFVDQLVWEF